MPFGKFAKSYRQGTEILAAGFWVGRILVHFAISGIVQIILSFYHFITIFIFHQIYGSNGAFTIRIHIFPIVYTGGKEAEFLVDFHAKKKELEQQQQSSSSSSAAGRRRAREAAAAADGGGDSTDEELRRSDDERDKRCV